MVHGWTTDLIVGRSEISISCSVCTLYRLFKRGYFDVTSLPMKGKKKTNGHKEKRGKQAFKRTTHHRDQEYDNFKNEFGHLEGDTIVGKNHKSTIITLVERLSKVIINLKPAGKQAIALKTAYQKVPKHLFKSITFDCGKEFSNLKSISNLNDIDIYLADSGTLSQRGLNENSTRKSLNYKTLLELFF